jgi:CheY-like chemotaxis protein
VLIADDDALVRIVLRAALERSGYRVVAAENGAAAIKMAQSGSPDVVILDARMPGLSLDEILARVQPTPETGPPVLVLSGQLGAPRGGLGPRVGTLTKPVELRALLAELDRLLELG